MSDIIKTVKVKPWGNGQGDFVEINEEDFDEAKHELYVESEDGPDEATAEEIVDAIGNLDPAEDAHWTKGGLPDVGTLVEALGKKVTRAMVDAAAPDAKRPVEE